MRGPNRKSHNRGNAPSPDLRRFACKSTSPRTRGEEKEIPFSRCRPHPSLVAPSYEKDSLSAGMIPKSGVRFSDQDHAPLTKRGIQFGSPENKGGGAPNGAPPVPASERDAGAVICDRSPFGAPPRLCAEVIHPNSAWAALPGIAGCKREDPLRRQCSRHPAVRSRAGRDDAQTACR